VGADAVLEGTVLEDARGGRLTIELTDVSRQVVLWSATYALSQDLFQIQDSVAREVAQALHVSLTPHQFAQVQRGRSVDPQAHELVLRAKGYGEQRSDAALARAIALYQEALRRDSSYAEAWAGIAEAYNLQGVFSPVRPRDAFRLAAVATDRALALDDRSASAHRSRGFLAVFYTHDWETGRAEFQRALDLDSLAAGTWLFRAWYFGGMRQYDSLLATLQRARALDSLTPINAIRLADMLYRAGQDSAARAELTSVLRRDPANELARSSLAPVLARLGDCPSALSTLPPQPDEGVAQIKFFVRTWGLCGRTANVRDFLQTGERRLKSGQTVSPVSLALGSTFLGDERAMYRWLDYAVANGDWMIFYLNIEPEFAPFRREPRFRALLQRAGLPST
jgi:Tfp pilus assembly protein PilF